MTYVYTVGAYDDDDEDDTRLIGFRGNYNAIKT